MKILRLADLPARPWKNGGGVTTEYAVSPEGADLDAFDWRISRARVASDGPFSIFPDIDRTLTVVEGCGIDLAFADRSVRLDPTTPPYPFPGDVPVTGLLAKGPIEDLNVMTRRGRLRHAVTRRSIAGEVPLETVADLRVVIALAPLTTRGDDGAVVALASGDALIVPPGAPGPTLSATGADAAVLVVTLMTVAA